MNYPGLSIVLPTYNRSKFLATAFDSIRNQTFQNWELIVVDDGSTDNTRELVEALKDSLFQPVRYLYQSNQGPAAARNCGISASRSNYIAFYDSDDKWLPHHLENCFRALEENPDVDWICTDLARVELATGRIVEPSKFHSNGKDLEFLKLRAERRGDLYIITDSRLTTYLIKHGGFGSLQCSVLRRKIVDSIPLRNYRIGEDRLFAVEVSLSGHKLAYFDRVHVHFGVHDAHTTTGSDASPTKTISVFKELLAMYDYMLSKHDLKWSDRCAVRQKASQECFWNLAYAGLWQNEHRLEALKYFRHGIRLWPWSAAYWKTYLGARLRFSLITTKNRSIF